MMPAKLMSYEHQKFSTPPLDVLERLLGPDDKGPDGLAASLGATQEAWLSLPLLFM